MKKISWKGKVFLGTLGATALTTPLLIASAVACFSEKKPIDKSQIVLNTNPVNGTIFLNQKENLPTLSVEAKVDNQNAKLAYQWYESDSNSTTNGKAIPGATQSTYTIPQTYAQNIGKKYFYAIISSSIDGTILVSKISEIYTININQIPRININTQPQNFEGFINQTNNLPTFSVDATTNNSSQRLTYQWYKSNTNQNTNGTAISGANGSSYTVPSSDLKTVGQKHYYVQIGGTINGINLQTVSSNIASLRVNALPVIAINTQPQNFEGFINQTNNLPTFSVAVSNIEGAQLKYQWYKSNTNQNTNGTAISGANGSSYTVPSSDLKTVGQKHYYVQIGGTINGINLQTVSSNIASLRVNALPNIIISSNPQNQTYDFSKPDQTAPTFSVNAKANSSDVKLKYQWYKNESGQNDGWKIINGANGSSYKVPKSDIPYPQPGEIRLIFYYVKIIGSIGGAQLIGVNSEIATLYIRQANS